MGPRWGRRSVAGWRGGPRPELEDQEGQVEPATRPQAHRGSKKNRKRKALKKGKAKLQCAKVKDIKNCHCSAPLKHRRVGATKPSDYALPECWMYPLKTKKQVYAARRYFSRYQHTYPRWAQQKMNRRITAAEKRKGIGRARPAAPRRQRRKAA
jgi:hypothetical protein